MALAGPSCIPTGWGADRVLIAASTTARLSGVSRIRYSVTPPPMSDPHDRFVNPDRRSC